jgi:hypothetical protein
MKEQSCHSIQGMARVNFSRFRNFFII